MRKDFVISILILALVALSKQEPEENREKRSNSFFFIFSEKSLIFYISVFSLFNVVTFKNDACASSDSGRNGTCYTTTECQNKGGRALGNCAAGFGVCCVFIITSTGEVNQNCSYIQNPSYPSTYSDTTSLTYTIKKCSDEVCMVRLDFDSFTIRGPAATNEVTNGHNCQDSFTVTGTSGLSSPTICGMNSGQHVYMDMGHDSTNSATVSFTFSGTSTTRQWDIKVTQIPCYATNKPPGGCLQYHTDLAGRIKTFNFDDSSDQQHLASQEYNICIRQQAGYCCVEYSLCSDTNSWTLDADADISDTPDLDTQCNSDDHLRIQGFSAECDPGNSNIGLHTKLCGTQFGPSTTMAPGFNTKICDCVAPFNIEVYTDAIQEAASVSRGACLEYNQVPCVNNN